MKGKNRAFEELISIHASREGSDKCTGYRRFRCADISIHASREGSDAELTDKIEQKRQFQSTLPVREATRCSAIRTPLNIFQSTLPAREATIGGGVCWPKREFQSTLPAREATAERKSAAFSAVHFNPRFPQGKRRVVDVSRCCDVYFNPRFPQGERLFEILFSASASAISIHASRKGSDHLVSFSVFEFTVISIHASRKGSDPAAFPAQNFAGYFNPRFPQGKRLNRIIYNNMQIKISIHASREGSDLMSFSSSRCSSIFQSTLPAREATKKPYFFS